jgi:predicted permease
MIGARLRNALRLLFRPRQVEAELDEEIQSFYDTMTERFITQGMTPSAARRAARVQFTGSEQVKEQVRDARAGAFLDFLLRETRYALRGIRKNPVFAFVTILTLGLGIGANSTVFSLVNRFVLASPPVHSPDRLLTFYTVENGDACCSNDQSYPLYADVRDQVKSFSSVAAYYDLLPASIDTGGDPARIWGQAATTNFFDSAQLPLLLGRGFRPEEETAPVVVLGNGLWRRRFHADPNVAGTVVRLSGQPFTVIGVAPPSFRGLDAVLDAEFWVPLGLLGRLQVTTPDREDRASHWLSVVGRLAPNTSRRAADAELQVIAKRLSSEYPAFHKDLAFRMQTAGSVPARFQSGVRMFLTALTIVAFLVLCIACANVTNLAQARIAGRQQESAVRIALGATRGHLLGQMITEAVLLAIGGGVCALLLSVWATRSLGSFHIPAPVPLQLSVPVDWKTLLYTFCVSAAAGLICGVLPAWSITKGVVANAMKGQDLLARPGRYWTLSNVLVVAQLAMSIVLLSTTVLFLRSLERASRIEIGFRSRGVLMMDVDPRLHGYSPQRTAQFLELARQKALQIPEVDAAAYGDSVPLSGGHRSDGMIISGRPETNHTVDLYMVSAHYAEALGIPRIAGRDFQPQDGNGDAPRVAVVDEEFVREFFPDGQALSRDVSDGDRTYRIIGVVKNIKSRTLGEQTRPVLFRSLAQDISSEASFSGYSVLVKYRGNPAPVAGRLRAAIHTIDPSLAIVRTQTMEEHMDDAFFLPRLASTLFAVFGTAGLALTVVGLYGLMNYWVSRSTKEIGVRLALGARAGQVQALIIRKGLLLVVIALFPGLPAAFALNRLYASLLYGVDTHDPVTFTVVPLLLTFVAIVACWIPASRAAGSEPLVALRDN